MSNLGFPTVPCSNAQDWVIPAEIIHHICSYLDPKDLAAFRKTSRLLNNILNNGMIELNSILNDLHWCEPHKKQLYYCRICKILESGLEFKNISRELCFDEAIGFNQPLIVRMILLDNRVDPAAKNNLAIRVAAENRQLEIVKLLLNDDRVDPSVDNNFPLIISSNNGDTEIMKLLLKDWRVNPGAMDNYAIKLASFKGHAEIVRLLLNNERVDPAADINYSIRIAAEHGHVEVVKLLLNDLRVDISADNNYAFRSAFREGHFEIVKLLLKANYSSLDFTKVKA